MPSDIEEEYSGEEEGCTDEEPGYGDDEEQDYDEDQSEPGNDEEVDDFPEVAPVAARPEFKVLTRAELAQRRQEAIAEISNVMCVMEDDAARLLRANKWNVERTKEDWFTNKPEVCALVGLQRLNSKAPPPAARATSITVRETATCRICYDEFPVKEMKSAACLHWFCHGCWGSYVTSAVGEGPAKALDLRCPTPKCEASVPFSVVQAVAPPDVWDKFQGYVLRSYVEDNSHMGWCVGKNCEAAVEVREGRATNKPLDVLCSHCQTAFCFACKEEAHRPVSCQYVRQWVAKNSDESENVQWIILNTKQCPKCNRAIEKNQGCMHMTCSQCRHEFCWLCLGDWRDHGERTGGYYGCNRYEAAKREGKYSDQERQKETAKAALDRYVHYFERWNAHQKARNQAKVDMAGKVQQSINTLSEQTKTPTSQLKFILDAWEQVVECRRVLSWTYAYSYYEFDPADASSSAKAHAKDLFEFYQCELEHTLEGLHGLAETELAKLAGKTTTRRAHASTSNAGSSAEDPDVVAKFETFRQNLKNRTDLTRRHFKQLVDALEDGFAKAAEAAI